MDLMLMFVRMTLKESTTDRFRATLADTVRVAKERSDGLLGYEWFLSDDDRECTVVEIYDGPDAHARHFQRVVVPHASKLRELASSQVSLGGAVPPEMLSQMRARLGDVPYLGPCFSGLLNSSEQVTSRAPLDICACVLLGCELQTTATEAVLDLAAAVSRELKSQQQIVVFEWFLNEDTRRLTVVGLGRSSEAIAAHVARTAVRLETSCSATNIEINAFGVARVVAATAFQSLKLGRSGGKRIEGVL